MLIFLILLSSTLISFVSPDGGGEGLTSSSISPRNLPILPPPPSPQALTLPGGHEPSNLSNNLTLNHLSPRSVSITWSCHGHVQHQRFEVTLKPILASYRVVETVPQNVCYLSMDNLVQDTVYQISVSSISSAGGRGARKRLGSIVFRTPMENYSIGDEDEGFDDGDGFDDPNDFDNSRDPNRLQFAGLKFPKVRFVEISLVVMALILWAGAIVLFFHRWGKIRMLLPYQPDFKEMEKPTSGCTTCSLTPHHQCSTHLKLQIQPPNLDIDWIGPNFGHIVPNAGSKGPGHTLSKSRINNSFIGYNLSDIMPSEIRICRRAKSAEELSISYNLHNYEDIDFSDF